MYIFGLVALLAAPSDTTVSMVETCQAHVLEQFETSAERLKLRPPARRADGSWAITGTLERPGAVPIGFQCEIDRKGHFLGAAQTSAGSEP